MWQQQQAINYWNQRVELNKARWNPQMRETFDRNLQVIDQAIANAVEPQPQPNSSTAIAAPAEFLMPNTCLRS